MRGSVHGARTRQRAAQAAAAAEHGAVKIQPTARRRVGLLRRKAARAPVAGSSSHCVAALREEGSPGNLRRGEAARGCGRGAQEACEAEAWQQAVHSRLANIEVEPLAKLSPWRRLKCLMPSNHAYVLVPESSNVWM